MTRFTRDWPIRWQLSVLYAGLQVIVLGALGVLLYVQIQHFLIVDAADRLVSQVNLSVVRTLPDPAGIEKKLGAAALPSTDELLRKAGSVIVNDIETKGTHVAVYDTSGAVMAEGQNLLQSVPWPTISSAVIDSILSGNKPYVAPVGPQQPGALRVVVPINTGKSIIGYVVISYVPAGVFSSLLAALRTYLLLGVVLAALAGIGAGVPITRRILRPLDRMADTASAIAAGDLNQRVGMEGRNEIGRLGAAFDHMVAQLGAVLQAQRQFVADASHELRTPVTALSGMAEMLLMGADRGDPAARQRLLHQIQAEVARMSRLVSDLLALSQLDASPRLQRAPVDLAALACRVFEAAQPLHADRVLLPPDKAGVIVSGDADRLRQVLLNLLDNAVKYTGAGGRIQCICRADGDWAVLTILDDGEGIPAPALAHIFDRFYRVDTARARRVGGFGLGLAIVRSIVEAHGGTISAASEGPGAGSSFTTRLPLSSGPLLA